MKSAASDLAVLGGRPSFADPLSVGHPSQVDRRSFLERVERVLESGRHSNGGPFVEELESRIADLAGVRHCVAMCNATTALQVLARARGIQGEVVMPSMTFIATAHAMRWIGLDPVFCDVDPMTGQIDPHHARSLITPRTGAIIGVHLWGRPCPARELEEVATEHGIDLYLDAAHAIGCVLDGTPVGSFGDAEVFSLHATKVVGGFEGGVLVTDDGPTADRVRALHAFGHGTWNEHGGTNAKMSEVSAAMALTSLDAFPKTVAHNHRNHDLYVEGLSRLPGISVERFDPAQHPNHQYVIIRVDPTETGVDRDALHRVLRAENVFTRPYFSPACHQTEPYASRPIPPLPHTERLAETVLALPTGTGTSPTDVETVCDIIRLAVSHGDRIVQGFPAAPGQEPHHDDLERGSASDLLSARQ